LGRLSKQSTDLQRLSHNTDNDAIINEITGLGPGKTAGGPI
jgi:hypothetical protein